MKSEGQIAQKAKQLRFRHLKRELERLLSKRSSNCKNNTILQVRGGEVGVCKLDCTPCDSREEDRASECGLFENLLEKDQIKESLKTFFETRPLHEIAVRYPDVAALQWAADEAEGNLFPSSLPVITLDGIPLWVDSDKERLEVEKRLAECIKSRKVSMELTSLLMAEEGDLADRISAMMDELGRRVKMDLENQAKMILSHPPPYVDHLGMTPVAIPEEQTVPWWKRVKFW